MSRSAPHRHESASPAAAPAAPRRGQFVLDRAASRALDRAATEDYGISGLVLMENAARSLREVALRMLGVSRDVSGPRRSAIVCGSGNNGGDGWALARHLHNAGVEVVVLPMGEPAPGSDAAVNRAIARAMGLAETTVDDVDALRGAHLVVDAIFGTGLAREVTGAAAEVITRVNEARRPVLAVDLPSGLDCDRGVPLGACVRATVTVTFAALKPGLNELAAQPLVGEVVVGDIGCPRELVEHLGTPLPPTPDHHGRHDG